MARPSDLVLITGATGHVGSRTLLHLLRAGHRVRAAVRSEKKAAAVLARPEIQALGPAARPAFVVVPDIAAPGAYEEAVGGGVTHVVHIASPLATGAAVPPGEQHESRFVRPAVRGTLEMLEAAHRSGTVRRVVVTSSITAIVPVGQMEGAAARPAAVRPHDRVPLAPGPYGSEFAAYAASKVAALQQAEAWAARERPAFDVVHLHPSFVLGRNDAATTAGDALRGTNAVLLAMLLGKRFGPYAGATVHVDDVARAHVQALDPRVLGGQSYILSQPARWNDAKGIANAAFPAAMETRLLVGGGNVDSTRIPIDTSLTEQVFGLRFMGFKEQVESTVGQFLELRLQRRPAPSQDLPVRLKRKEALLQVSANA